MSKERLSEKLQTYAKAYKEPPYGREVNGTVELLEETAKKLAEYEDLEEQGLLLRLPVAVGSKAYLINSRYTKCTKYEEEFDEYSCQGCEDECDSHKEYYIHENKSVSAEWIIHNAKDFGKTVFLTQSEAEEKLRELEK